MNLAPTLRRAMLNVFFARQDRRTTCANNFTGEADVTSEDVNILSSHGPFIQTAVTGAPVPDDMIRIQLTPMGEELVEQVGADSFDPPL